MYSYEPRWEEAWTFGPLRVLRNSNGNADERYRIELWCLAVEL